MTRRKKQLFGILLALCFFVNSLCSAALPVFAETVINSKMAAFINDSRWSAGTSWGGSQKPKISPYGSLSCCAYVADFAKYVYGKSSPTSGTRFTSVSGIKDGDIINIGSPSDGTGHWFVVLKRDGNRLYTAEGNYSAKVRIGWNYTISGTKFAEDKRSFTAGWHYTLPNDVPQVTYDAIASGNYYLVNNDNNLFLNVLDGSGANKQNVLLAGYNGAEKFNMRIDYAASGSYIRPNFTSRVLNPFSDSVTSGVNVNIYDKSTDGTQLWMFKKVDTGYVIYNKANQGVVLSISGTNVIVENYKGTTWQTWSLVPVAEVEKWLCEKNGHTWDAGVVTKKPTATAEGEKSFTCSNCGATKTEAIEPTGQTELKITQHPKNMEATSGVVKFYIDAVGDGLTYQWYWRKNASSTWGICGFTGSKTDTVSVEAIAARDGYQYRCEVTDQYGNKLTSNYATLTTIPKAKITVQPKDVTVSSGTVKFSVTAVGDELTYQWYWRKNASSAWGLCGFTGSKTSTVSVEAIAARNGYQYQCVVTDKYGNTATSSAVQLNVISKATIISNPKDVTAASGNVIFGVTASGDGLTYQWYWRKNSSSEWGICGFTGNKTNALSVEAIAARNGFQYQCIVTDKYGNKATSTAATLKVISKATITKNPTSVSVYSGTVKFSVAATGDDIAYQWYWRKNSSSEWAVCGFTGNKTNTLSVEAIPARNGFQYQCVVTDKYGNKATSTAAVLTVNASAKVTQNPMNVSASSGTVRFYIVAEGKDLTYQWYWRKNASSEWAICGFEGNKTDTLKVEVIPARNGFQYRCVVKDGAGNTAASGYATLTVE